jgi:hypothetical protein
MIPIDPGRSRVPPPPVVINAKTSFLCLDEHLIHIHPHYPFGPQLTLISFTHKPIYSNKLRDSLEIGCLKWENLLLLEQVQHMQDTGQKYRIVFWKPGSVVDPELYVVDWIWLFKRFWISFWSIVSTNLTKYI